MTPASAKAKGRELQKDVVAAFLAAFPHLEPDDVRSTSMGAGGEDVQLSPAARRVIPHQVECKSYAKHAVYAFYDQAATHGKHRPLVVLRANRRKPLAVVDFDFFVELLQARSRP